MKTIKQIADEIGASKQQVYRFVKKNNIKEIHQERSTMYYDEVAENIIKSEFLKKQSNQGSESNTHQMCDNDVIIDVLKKELESKDRQIEKLMNLLDQQQRLTLDLQSKLDKQQELIETQKPTGLFRRFKRGK